VRKNKPKGYWMDFKNWRTFFREMAADLGYDPSQPETWPPFSKRQIVDMVLLFLSVVLSSYCSTAGWERHDGENWGGEGYAACFSWSTILFR